MKIQVLKKLDYRGYAVLVRHFGTIFEYLLVKDGQIYGSYFDIKPRWYRRFLTKKYSKNEMNALSVDVVR